MNMKRTRRDIMKRVATRLADERGIAVIVALLVSMVVVTLGVTSVTLAIHNSETSNYDRRRVQAITAAEAGVNWYFSHFQSVPAADYACSFDRDLATTPPTHFSAEATFYDGTGAVMPCPITGTTPSRALITSVGTSTTNPVPARTMQALVELSVLSTGAFQGVSIYSETSMTWPSNVKLFGRTGDDGNLYSNGNITLKGNDVVGGDVTARGTVTLEQAAQVRGDVTAGALAPTTAISMRSSSVILGNATASNSSIVVQQNKLAVYGTARAGTSISASGTAIPPANRIIGTSTFPERSFPDFEYNESGWVSAGYEPHEFNNCGQAETFLTTPGSLDGKELVRITADCILELDGNAPALTSDLAIVSDGSLSMGSNTAWESGDGLQHSLHLVFGFDKDGTPCDIVFGNNATVDPGFLTFFHTPCTVNMGSSALILEGQIIAGTVIMRPGTTMTFRPIPIPGMGGGTPAEDIVYVREIVTT
jgi:hypothetical protein